jgi:peptide chain release factor 3
MKSAANNFGVQLLLEGFLKYSPPPAPRVASSGLIPVDHPKFSGFIFKIQSNMDPMHRDSIAFMRICSGKFERDMYIWHSGTGKELKLSNSHKLFGQDREIVNEGYPGDIVGLVGHSEFRIGDTLSEDKNIVYHEIPKFPPEVFTFINNPNPGKYKQYRKGLEQLLSEGIVQSFTVKNSGRNPLLAAVGPLQFEVLQYRLQSEYNAECQLEAAQWQSLKWIDPSVSVETVADILPFGAALAQDTSGQNVILFPAEWSLRAFRQDNPKIPVYDLPQGTSSFDDVRKQ